MQRRGFLGAILAAGAAPAFVGSGVLMPVKAIWMPPPFSITAAEIIEQAFARLKLYERAEYEFQALGRTVYWRQKPYPAAASPLTFSMKWSG